MMYDKVVPSRKYSFYLAKGSFLVENGLFLEIEDFSKYFSIFHDFRDWVSFSLHFLIIRWMLQPLITNGITTVFKIKVTVCA